MAPESVVLHSGSTITSTTTAVPAFAPGDGATAGTLDQMESAPVSVVPDAQLRVAQQIESLALPLLAAGAVVSSMLTPAGTDAVLLLSPDGSEAAFAPAVDLVGTALTAAWRYRLVLRARLFDDGTAVDRFEVRY
jgi:hypothetical protein